MMTGAEEGNVLAFCSVSIRQTDGRTDGSRVSGYSGLALEALQVWVSD